MTQTQDDPPITHLTLQELRVEYARVVAENAQLAEYRDRFLAYWHMDIADNDDNDRRTAAFIDHMRYLHDDMRCGSCMLDELIGACA